MTIIYPYMTKIFVIFACNVCRNVTVNKENSTSLRDFYQSNILRIENFYVYYFKYILKDGAISVFKFRTDIFIRNVSF